MANLPPERGDRLRRHSLDDFVLEMDCRFAGVATAGEGLVFEGFDQAVDFSDGWGAVGEDAGAQAEHVGELLAEWAVGAEPAHFAGRGDGPEFVGYAGHVDGDVARAEGQSSAADADGGLAGNYPFDQDHPLGPGLVKSALGDTLMRGGPQNHRQRVGQLALATLGTSSTYSLCKKIGHNTGGMVTLVILP